MAGVIGGEATGCDEATTHRLRRMRPVRSGPHRTDRTASPDHLRRPPAVRARARSGSIAGCDRGRYRADLGICAAANRARSPWLAPNLPGNVTPRCALPASRALEVPIFRPTRLWTSLERLGFAVRRRDAERVTVAVPSWRNDIAAPISLISPRHSIRPTRAKAAEGCVAVEAEHDLIEEVLRLRGLDAVPPVSLLRGARCRPATLTAPPAARRPGPPHPRSERPDGVRHLQLHGARRC